MSRWLMMATGTLLALGTAPFGLQLKDPPSSLADPLPAPWGETWSALIMIGSLAVIAGAALSNRPVGPAFELTGTGLAGGMLVVYALALLAWRGPWLVGYNSAITLSVAVLLLSRWVWLLVTLLRRNRLERELQARQRGVQP